MFLLCDETYDSFTYAPVKHESLAAFVESENPNYAVVGSFSKTYSMTGWRLGYCIACRKLIEHLNALQSHSTGNASTIAQWAALSLFENESDGLFFRETILSEFAARRILVCSFLQQTPGFRCFAPDGAFYVFPEARECLQRLGLENSDELARLLLHEGRVATVPGSAFGRDGFIRISYAVPTERLQEGLQRIREITG